VGLGDTWGHGAGTWGGLRGPARWNETFRVTLGDTGLGHGAGLGDKWGHGVGHGVGLGDQHGGMRLLGWVGLGRGQVGTWGWDMGWV